VASTQDEIHALDPRAMEEEVTEDIFIQEGGEA
jgi:hypothetical protein